MSKAAMEHHHATTVSLVNHWTECCLFTWAMASILTITYCMFVYWSVWIRWHLEFRRHAWSMIYAIFSWLISLIQSMVVFHSFPTILWWVIFSSIHVWWFSTLFPPRPWHFPPFSHGFPIGFPMKPPFSYGFPMGFPMVFTIFPWLSHDFQALTASSRRARCRKPWSSPSTYAWIGWEPNDWHSNKIS